MIDEKLIKLQHFFEADIKIKKEMFKIAPPAEGEYYDDQSLCKYTDDVNASLIYIFSELKCIALDIFGNNSLVLKQVCDLENSIKKQFYSCGFDINRLRSFYKTFVSNMNINFLNSVKTQCVGYASRGYSAVEEASSLNEILHFIHSYIMNNESVLQAIPQIHNKINQFNYPIVLRGKNVPLFEQLYIEFPNELDVGWTDMVVVNDNKLLMMVRDRGHALTIEITVQGENARMEYFIPKLCNIDMINALPGINRINEESIGARGVVEIPVENLSSSLFNFISKVPTDDDMIIENNRSI